MSMDFIKNIWNKKDAAIWLVFLRVIIGAEWFIAGIQKVIDPAFVTNMGGTMTFFASGAQPWMANWITSMIPSSVVFGNLTAWGELLVGLGLILGALTNLAALAGIFFNFLFFFAAGWTGPSTASVNWIMWGLTMIILLSPGAKRLSIDRLVSTMWLPVLFRWLVDWFGFEKEANKHTEQVK